MGSKAKWFIRSIALQVLISFFANHGIAAEADRNFVTEVLSRSNCNLTDQFVDEFSAAMDRLNFLNPSLTSRIRLESYARKLWLTCVDIKDSENIFYSYSYQTIYLRKNANNDVKTPASFFHEFLHFVGVKIDQDAHNKSLNLNIQEDHVYGCQFAVFPQVIPKEWPPGMVLKESHNSCSKAEIE